MSDLIENLEEGKSLVDIMRPLQLKANLEAFQAQRDEEKYFTPEISDIRVGYECEIFCKKIVSGEYDTKEDYEKQVKETEEKWYPHEFKLSTFSFKDNEGKRQEYKGNILIGNLEVYRTPYLTKEQIEKSEDWHRYLPNYYWYNDPLKYGKYRLGLYGEHFTILEDNQLIKNIKISKIYNRYQDGLGQPQQITLYKSECKSINELRYIMKLLGIK